MVGSRTHFHSIAREFGSLPNGSLSAYGAIGEASQYLTANDRARASRPRDSGQKKPVMRPKTNGAVIETHEAHTSFGWSTVYLIAANHGYVVEFYCPRDKRMKIHGTYGTMEEAQGQVEKLRNNLREYGMKNPSALGNIGVIGAGDLSVPLMLALASVYIGLDFPGARSGAKLVKNFINEPIPKIQTGLLFIGTAAIIMKQFQNA
tara:strand:+ start:220 stop:834 length:615 start_codon:yes stop_codon:yes gene_type:complete